MVMALHILAWIAFIASVLRLLWWARKPRTPLRDSDSAEKRKQVATLIAYLGACVFMAGWILASLGQKYAFIIFGISAAALFASVAIRLYRA